MCLRFSLSRFGRLLQFDRLPVALTPDDGFTRFLFQKSQYTQSTGRVKPPCLLPDPRKARLETSVHRTDGLQPFWIWVLGYEYVETPQRRMRARASGVISMVTAQGLHIDVNGRPYPRHADIIGWPATKHEQMMLVS